MAVIKRPALGRGLDSLIAMDDAPARDASAINEIELSRISPNPDQPRSIFDEEALEELSRSVTEFGIIQPISLRKNFGSWGPEIEATRVSFVSQAAKELGIKERLGLKSEVYAVNRCRQITKADMVRNTATPHIEVDPETFNTYVDGVLATVPPAKELPLGQLYFFS